MSFRLGSVLELPASVRAINEHLFDKAAAARTPAAQKLYLERLQEERERLTLAMLKQLEYLNLAPLFVREYRFHPQRRWRLDLYCDAQRLGIELHGGLFSGGRHTRGNGFRDDREKMNAAVELGIRVLEYWPQAIADGSAAAQVERLLACST